MAFEHCILHEGIDLFDVLDLKEKDGNGRQGNNRVRQQAIQGH